MCVFDDAIFITILGPVGVMWKNISECFFIFVINLKRGAWGTHYTVSIIMTT